MAGRRVAAVAEGVVAAEVVVEAARASEAGNIPLR
jgi:hypothetical protein